MEMTTKHLLIFGAGILTGYLLVDYLRRKTPTTTPVAAVNPKVALCEAMLQQNLMTARIPSDQIEAYKAQFMSDCLSGTGQFETTTTDVVCPPSINCMPTTDGTMHPYCTNMPQECVGITSKAV